MTQPRIAAFARVANGNVEPKRVIEGQATKMGRTMHGIDYDPMRDEIVATNPLAAAVLVFRGGANGEEAPIRVIQGPKTRMVFPQAVTVDPKNKEYIVSDPEGRSVLIFAADANGDVAPLRAIGGPATQLGYVAPIGIDHDRGLLVVSNRAYGAKNTGLYVYNRTDNGNVAPQSVISGSNTGMMFPWQIQVYKGRVFVALLDCYFYPLFDLLTPRKDISPDIEIKSPWPSWPVDKLGSISVWNITDNGDVPPRAIIKGPASRLIHPGGVAINPKRGEVYAVDTNNNGLFTFLVPDFFQGISEEIRR